MQGPPILIHVDAFSYDTTILTRYCLGIGEQPTPEAINQGLDCLRETVPDGINQVEYRIWQNEDDGEWVLESYF